ncbi:MAG: ATP-binding protein, partial [Chitinophagaceae bacterium]|nr:ATP-binding protein [Chitinophagaceae bacterium]
SKFLKMFQRSHLQHLINRVNEPRKFIQVVMGPRQVGKTTLVRQLLEKISIPSNYISADDSSSNPVWLNQQWDLARLKCRASEGGTYLLVIDEIQKIVDWSEKVKLLWDDDTFSGLQLKVVILGSSRLLLQQGLTESLAGRFEKTFMGHWSFIEMSQAFGWNENQYVWFGGYPGTASLISDEKRWRDYVSDALIETSISKDILLLTRVDKPALMRRLFELGCLYSSQVLSYTKMLGQLKDAKNTTTLSHYLQLLETAGLLSGIEKYSPNIIRQRSSSPKFLVHNTALISAQRNVSFDDGIKDGKFWGRMVESSVGAHLINSSYSEDYNIHYWKQDNHEIDFVLERDGNAIALEVKSNDEKIDANIKAFHNQFQQVKIILVGEKGLPWQEFLKMNPADLF